MHLLVRGIEMRRKRLSVEIGFVAVLAVVGLILCIVVRDVGLKVGFGSISLLLGFYLVLNFANTEKAVCPQCGKRLRKRRIRKDRVSRDATGNGSGAAVPVTVICPQCGKEETVWKK